MDIGDLCFISDQFFSIVKDENLKKNHVGTKRPHVVSFYDETTNLYWVAPCSTRIKKYSEILERKPFYNAIKIVDNPVLGGKSAILFQDIFPVSLLYMSAYIKQGQALKIEDTEMLEMFRKTAQICIHQLKRGITYTPTQPNVRRIERQMLYNLCHGR